MTPHAIMTLEALHPQHEDNKNQRSGPYIWPTVMQIEKTEGMIMAPAPPSERARVVIINGQSGVTGGSPAYSGLPAEFLTETHERRFVEKGQPIFFRR